MKRIIIEVNAGGGVMQCLKYDTAHLGLSPCLRDLSCLGKRDRGKWRRNWKENVVIIIMDGYLTVTVYDFPVARLGVQRHLEQAGMPMDRSFEELAHGPRH